MIGLESRNGTSKISEAIEDLTKANPIEDVRQYLEAELSRIESTVKSVKPVVQRAKRQIEFKVIERPWTALGIVSLVSFTLGALLGMWRK